MDCGLLKRRSYRFSGTGGFLGIPRIDPKKPEDLRLRLATEGEGSLIEGEKGALGGGARTLRVVVWLRRREGLLGAIEAVSRVEAALRYVIREAFPQVPSRGPT